ncbi:uncharacterized protein LOC110254391 [Exaiptasia diaphana]|uniref:Uncharacterized protein n=1 Tax=Exaiptasia diaphana TaxID=2652724 RepID=A0A913Y9N4_EXADI|nr:uncharacterized protein LOC110254391 [Exaiptasia diaphana]
MTMDGSAIQYTTLIYRVASKQKRWIIALALVVFVLVFILEQSHLTFTYFKARDINAVFQITEAPEEPLFDTIGDVRTTKSTIPREKIQDMAENITNIDAVCRLPVLDPNHSSVRDLIVDFGKLDCGTRFSTFENNVLHVEAYDVVSVSYRIINRPEGNDFGVKLSEPVLIANDLDVTQVDQPPAPGQVGCFMHTASKKCLHPRGGNTRPRDGTALVFHSDCCLKRIEFKMAEDASIIHGQSGLCLYVNLDDNTVSLRRDCSTTFTVVNGSLLVTGSELCIESRDRFPRNDERAIAGSSCSHAFKVVTTKGRRFNGSAYVNADFVRVDIRQSGRKPDVTEFRMQAAPKPEVFNRTGKHTGIPVNICLIMFDSTSAANFIRQMTKTNEYLKTRPTVYMKGQTIVGDGTTAQLCAMLTGIAEQNQPEARRSKPNSKFVDDWRWVFQDYRNHGYVTMYSEDSPSLASFNYRLKGFKNPPTDHYGRYFWIESERHQKVSHCVGNDAIHRLAFNYILSLFRTYEEHRKFTFINFSDLTHSNMNSVKYADEDLVELLQTMEKENFLDDTIIFIFGDHGMRFGKMRQTLQGKLEERLPHMSITFPTWFPKKHPKLYEAVQHNSHLLTTPFDIYATLQHVLSYPFAPKGIHVGQSLFYPIDAKKRTCESTGVEDHWCPCLNFESVPMKEPIVRQLANFCVELINRQLENEGSQVQSLCHKLTLVEIKSISREMPNEKLRKFKTSHSNRKCDSCGAIFGKKVKNTLKHDTLYQIQIITSPNNGFYEASLRVYDGKPKLQGSISRIDEYGKQPACIADTHVHLRKYCYCKVQN